MVVASCTTYFPPNHHFQDTLVQVIENLHKFDGPDSDNRFEDLPYFGIFMRDFLNDWTEDYEFYPDEFRRNGWKVEEVVSRWKCMTSFYSRISFVGRGTMYGIWECRRALEEPDVNGPLMETRLYGATEFITRCGECWCDTYFKNPPVDLDEDSKRMFWLGRLVRDSDIPLFGKKRLEFWKRRLVDIKENWQRYKLDEVTPERLEGAILKLDSIITSIDWEAATERNG
ncbi:hypothetical protein B0I35DRAFT_475526 [Stachybotrys elegans]|uniref:Uncharacterized protein n=1 Tax=Stachybotrys elegans TaxID=80388 RepID=A0A8K0SWP6_9HYPO|nr:hypothetical protein B0I35DRAFT_475526 [Stachybotrys elegans]